MGVVIPQNNLAAYNTDRYPSPAIWGDLPDSYYQLPGYYWHHWDDFHNAFDLSGGSTPGTDGLQQNYATYIDTSNTVRQLATEKMRGVLRLATDATDNDSPVITMAGNRGTSVMLDDNTVADSKSLWFEGRVRKDTITDNQCAIFLGFTEEARAVDDGVLADDSAVLVTTIDGIGFRVLQDNGEELDFTYQKASQVNQEMANIITAGTNAVATGMAVSTWVKLGFKYRPGPLHPTDKRIKVYVNNKEYTTYVTSTQMAAATFPDGEELAFAAASKNGEGTATNFDLDWIRICQEMLPT